MKRQQQSVGASQRRRAFLAGAGGGIAALAGAALALAGRAPKVEAAKDGGDRPGPGYRETPHIRAYYARARH